MTLKGDVNKLSEKLDEQAQESEAVRQALFRLVAAVMQKLAVTQKVRVVLEVELTEKEGA
jgi:hypothetical protein